jgi:hypothetical protein
MLSEFIFIFFIFFGWKSRREDYVDIILTLI